MPASGTALANAMRDLDSAERAAMVLEATIGSLDAMLPSCKHDLAPLQRAQAQLAEAEGAVALAKCLHALQGDRETFDAALNAEAIVLAAYQTKVQAAVAKQELSRSKRTLEVDIDAAHRFINHAIPDLTAQTRSDLKKVAADAARDRSDMAKPSLLASKGARHSEPVPAKKGISAIERAQRKRLKRAATGHIAVEAILDDLMQDYDVQ